MYEAVFKCNKGSTSLKSWLLLLFPSWLVPEKCGVWFDVYMKLENLPDGGHDKVIWKRNRDRSRDKTSQQHNSETWWRRTTAMLLGVSFGTYMRRRHDVPVRRREGVPLRRLGEFPLRRRWVFHLRRTWDVAGTHRETSLRRRHDVLLRGWTVKVKLNERSNPVKIFHIIDIEKLLGIDNLEDFISNTSF